jgi:hypothetical protein
MLILETMELDKLLVAHHNSNRNKILKWVYKDRQTGLGFPLFVVISCYLSHSRAIEQ